MAKDNSHVIRIDSEVYKVLQEQATPFEDSPNKVLRRVLGLEANVTVEDVPFDPTELETLLGADPMSTTTTATTTSPFYTRLPMRTRRTVRHNNNTQFGSLSRAIHAIIKQRFPDRFPAKVYPGSISWLGTDADLRGATGDDLTAVKLTFYGLESGIFDGEPARLDCCFGLRTELIDHFPNLAQLTFWDRRFKVPPHTHAIFVGFAVEDDQASVDKVRQVLAAM